MMMMMTMTSSSSFPRPDASPSSHPRVVAHITQRHVTSFSSSWPPCPHTRAYEWYTYHKNGLTFTVANGVVVPVALPGCALIASYDDDDDDVRVRVRARRSCSSFVRAFVGA